MRALLLPIKDLRNAKQRLAPLLTPAERLALAEAMLADTIEAVRGVRKVDRIFVVTNYAPAMQVAEENGWELLREEQQISESASVDAASRQCAERGIRAVLRLPLDVPLAQSADIDELLAIDCAAPALVIVPSRDGTGTNAILRTPPTLRAGAQIIPRNSPRLEMDVDDEADLLALVQHDLSSTETGAWLKRSGWMDQLRGARGLNIAGKI